MLINNAYDLILVRTRIHHTLLYKLILITPISSQATPMVIPRTTCTLGLVITSVHTAFTENTYVYTTGGRQVPLVDGGPLHVQPGEGAAGQVP
jgi:hypothetical protein